MFTGKIKKFVARNIFDNEHSIKADQYLIKLAEKESFVPYHTFLIPRNVVLAAGIWNTTLIINNDAEFVLRIMLNADKLLNTVGCHVLYRTHRENRLSARYTKESIKSLLKGYEIMISNLKTQNFKNKNFFKWRLRRVLLAFWRTDKDVLIKHKEIFRENGIYLSLANFYFIKGYIYKIVYPIVKKMKIKINSK
ncbi:hypothetical protein [Gillisia marina]|uniref:hypothetical protein n=1 Tax=Gillisia marina TaxID=1167637 RepID=UPI00029B283D|nr:hypothetical protein [Gillisia marina]